MQEVNRGLLSSDIMETLVVVVPSHPEDWCVSVLKMSEQSGGCTKGVIRASSDAEVGVVCVLFAMVGGRC